MYSTPYRLDRNGNGGDIMFFVRNSIPLKMISIEKLPIETFLIELNLRKKRSGLLIALTILIMRKLNLNWILFPRT